MTKPLASGWCWPLACALLLGACRGVEVRDPGPANEALYQQRIAQASALDEWGFSGKLSLDDGQEGGSGTLRWNVRDQSTVLDFRGAMGRGAWQLQITPHGATLTEADGSTLSAPDVESLVHDRIGWHVPVDALAWWVRGLEAPGPASARDVDADGRLVMLEQSGWNIEFGRYTTADGLDLPARLEARSGDHRVKLAIGAWRLGGE